MDADPADPADLVRSGYNALSRRYRGDDEAPEQYDRAQNDLQVTGQRFVPEGDSGHALFWARRM